jgi:uncharacterized RDD family membrane protein YckC
MARADDHWWQYRLMPAAFHLRAAALGVDVCLIVGLVGAYFWIFGDFASVVRGHFDPALRDTLPAGAFPAAVVKILVISFLIHIVYGIACEASPWSGSLGKRLVGIRVVDEYGEPLSLTAAVLRNLVKIVSTISLGLGFFAALRHTAGRTWHDRASGTFVALG